ncbi:hypothetical protein [Methylobacterium sp. WL9]|uniref:hypothetical protein n=1 Tax=Methylobacterium sp. WL9 TaxID=2603898 RepID=UPI00164F9D28|nr:hypothetical protein [Methylobacterium sp. WL9]
MFTFRETAPGTWRWSFVFRDQTLAHEEGFDSERRARAAAMVFVRDVGVALKKMPAWG